MKHPKHMPDSNDFIALSFLVALLAIMLFLRYMVE